MRSLPGLKYKAAVGPAAQGFAPNINVVDEPFAGTLDDYVAGNIKTLSALVKDYRQIDKAPFVTTKGLEGVKLVTENRQKGAALRQTFYFFANGGTKFVVTGSCLAPDGEKLDKVFDTSLRTFRFTR